MKTMCSRYRQLRQQTTTTPTPNNTINNKNKEICSAGLEALRTRLLKAHLLISLWDAYSVIENIYEAEIRNGIYEANVGIRSVGCWKLKWTTVRRVRQ